MLKMLIFCLFTLVVLSNVVSSNQTESSDDIVHTTHRPLDHDSGILHLPFFQKLRNPCSLCKEYNGSGFEFPLFSVVMDKTIVGKELIRDMLQNFNVCSNLTFPDLPEHVTLTELKEMEEKDALNKMYRAVVLHSAYSFIVHYELNVTHENCSQNSRDINKAKEVAYNLRDLACALFAKLKGSGYENDDIIPQFAEYVSLSCSGVELNVCQVMQKSGTLMQEIENYVVEKISSVHNSTNSTVYISSVSTEAASSSYTTISL